MIFIEFLPIATSPTHTYPRNKKITPDPIQPPRIDIENNNDEPSTAHLYLHPSMNRWHQIVTNRHICDEDPAQPHTKYDFKNVNNNELFLHRLTTASPAESIVSAPLTPTGNLIVNILDNLEHHHADDGSGGLNTSALNQKNLRNSTSCVIDRCGSGGGIDGGVACVTHSQGGIAPIITLAERRRQSQTKTIPIVPTSKTVANGFMPCVTIAINNNDTIDTVLQCDDLNRFHLDAAFDGSRGYSLSSSAPQCINYWHAST